MTGDWHSNTFRAALLAMVRRRVPERDAEDVVQAVLAEALASSGRPAEPDAGRGSQGWRDALAWLGDA